MTIRSNYSPHVFDQPQGFQGRSISSLASLNPTQTLPSTHTHFFQRFREQISSLTRPIRKVFSAQAQPRRKNIFENLIETNPKGNILQEYLNQLKTIWIHPARSVPIIQALKTYCMKHASGEHFALERFIAYNLIALSHLQQYDNTPTLEKIINFSLDTDKQRSFFEECLAQLKFQMRQDARWKKANTDPVTLERLVTELCDRRIKNSSV